MMATLTGIAVLSITISQSASNIPMTLPRLPIYHTIMKATCGRKEYVVSVRNAGFSSKLESATVDNKAVEFISPKGNLASSVATMHSVHVALSQCLDNGIEISVGGIDMVKSSRDYGTETYRFFFAK